MAPEKLLLKKRYVNDALCFSCCLVDPIAPKDHNITIYIFLYFSETSFLFFVPGNRSDAAGNVLGSEDPSNAQHLAPQSPKHRVKLPKFWSNGAGGSGGGGGGASSCKHQRQAMDDSVVNTSASVAVLTGEVDEIAKRRAFAHYDCQSLTTNLSYSVRIRKSLLAKRRNTTTGASAASLFARLVRVVECWS